MGKERKYEWRRTTVAQHEIVCKNKEVFDSEAVALYIQNLLDQGLKVRIRITGEKGGWARRIPMHGCYLPF